MGHKAKLVWLLAAQGTIACGAEAPDERSIQPDADKSAFHFFNPTPSEHMREMTTDGPGASDSPYTVDAGHFQIEMALVDFTTSVETFGDITYRVDRLAVTPLNLKIGLLNAVDLQLLIEPYLHVYEREDGLKRATHQGFGDTTVRIKYNLLGNDRGTVALAVMPYVTAPTSAAGTGNRNWEGGVILPFAAGLPLDFMLEATARFGLLGDILQSEGHHAEFGNSLSVAHQIFGDLDAYVEFFSNVSLERDVGWVGRFDTGLVYWLTDDLQLNGSVNLGLTKWADDWNLVAGFAWRY